MGCRKYRNTLSEAAAGALPPERRRKLDQHLERCATCAARFARLQRARAMIHSALSESAAAEPSQEWLRGIEQRLTEQKESREHRISYWVVAAATAAVLAVIVAAWTLRGRFVPRPAPARMVSVARPTTPPPRAQHEAGAKAKTFEAAAPSHRERAARAHSVAVSRRETEEDRRFLAEVKVQPETEAVAKLYRLLQSGEVDPHSLVAPARAEPQPMVIAPLRIKRLSIPPLETGSDSNDLQGRRTVAGTKEDTTP